MRNMSEKGGEKNTEQKSENQVKLNIEKNTTNICAIGAISNLTKPLVRVNTGFTGLLDIDSSW